MDTFILQSPLQGYYIKSKIRGKSDTEYRKIHARIKQLGLEPLGCICAGKTENGQIRVLPVGEQDLSKAILLEEQDFQKLFVMD